MRIYLNNWLTFSRIIMTPIILYMLYSKNFVTGLTIYVIACLTDLLDGYYARKFNTESNFGKILDPMADKWLTLALLIFLMHIGQIKDLIAYSVYLLLFRELVVITLRMYSQKLASLGSAFSGKIKTLLLDFSIFFLILDMIVTHKVIYLLGIYGLIISSILAAFSCVQYGIKFYKLLD